MHAYRKIILHYTEIYKAKRIDRWYRQNIRKRSYITFVEEWRNQTGKVNYALIKGIADIMELPNYYILPTDRMYILFCSPYSDLREVEGLILLEENGINDFTEETIYTKYKYAKNIFVTK